MPAQVIKLLVKRPPVHEDAQGVKWWDLYQKLTPFTGGWEPIGTIRQMPDTKPDFLVHLPNPFNRQMVSKLFQLFTIIKQDLLWFNQAQFEV